MSIRQFIADVMELPKAINAVNETIGGGGMSHTPWQLQRTPYESEIDIVSAGRVIAVVEAGEDKEKVAQMIVSAPDMLEALEEVVALTENLPVCPFCSCVLDHRPDCLSHEIESAIRKARGERYCQSEYGAAECKWEPGIGCTSKCPECN